MRSINPSPVKHPTVHNFVDATGSVFGRLTAKYYAGNATWLCHCECGKSKVVPYKQLSRGQTKSCGCLMIDRTKEANTKHGKKGTRIYRIWNGMLTRCRNPKSKDYGRYGGRGIEVCERWKKFENFYADMGDPNPGQTIERINNDGNYTAANCRWASLLEQANNRRNNINVEFAGTNLTASQWDRKLDRFRGTTARRVRQGLSVTSVMGPINRNLSRDQTRNNDTRPAA